MYERRGWIRELRQNMKNLFHAKFVAARSESCVERVFERKFCNSSSPINIYDDAMNWLVRNYASGRTPANWCVWCAWNVDRAISAAASLPNRRIHNSLDSICYISQRAFGRRTILSSIVSFVGYQLMKINGHRDFNLLCRKMFWLLAICFSRIRKTFWIGSTNLISQKFQSRPIDCLQSLCLWYRLMKSYFSLAKHFISSLFRAICCGKCWSKNYFNYSDLIFVRIFFRTSQSCVK